MPQTTVLPEWRASYPILCKAQKPGGITVLTNAAAPRVPNKPTYAAGTIQLAEAPGSADSEEASGEIVAPEGTETPPAEPPPAEPPPAEQPA